MNGKDKRRVTRFQDQMKVLIEALQTPDKSRNKCLKKLLKSVTRNSVPDDAEAVQLALGRDHEWRRHQVVVMKSLSKIIRLLMITEGTTFHEMEWADLVDLFVSCRIFDVINLLLHVEVPKSVTQGDASSSLGDSWESVYFHSLELTSNIIGSEYICDTKVQTRPFMEDVVTNRSFLDIVCKFAMDTTQPIVTCHALHILASFCARSESIAKRMALKKGLFPRLCEYVSKNYAVKMVSDWYKGGLEQYEFDMMGDRRQGMLPLYYQEAFDEHAVEEMTKDEQRQCVMTYAYSLHLFSLKIMSSLCRICEEPRAAVTKDPSLLDPCIRWLAAPVNNKFSAAACQESLTVVLGLCSSEAICHRLVSSYNLIELVERGVYFATYDHITHYFHLATKIAMHEGMLRYKIGAVESIARAASIHMYSHSHDLQLSMLAYLTYTVETEGVHHMIKYFGPHHIHYYPEYYFNEARPLNMHVTDLLRGYQHYARDGFLHARKQFTERLKSSKKLNRDVAERLKEQGNEFFQARQYEKAINRYTEALIICPPIMKNKELKSWYDLPITLYCNRAQCYLCENQYERAVKDCDKAVARCIGFACPINTRGNGKNNGLLRKALFRRSKGLFELGQIYRALSDISLCVRGDPTADFFKSLKDKILIQFREKHGTEPIPTCDFCSLGIGKKLKRCAHCTALYCSRDCQVEAWDKFHKLNCDEFYQTKEKNAGSNY